MASAKQIKARKLFAMRAKRGDFKKAITKTKKVKTNPKRKTLEKRLAILENKLNSVVLKSAVDYTAQAEMMKDPEFQVGLKLRDDLKRELDEGRNS